jgi:hypothetical protein
MVGTLKRWLKKWLGVDLLAAENLRLAKACKALETRFDSLTNTVNGDHDVRLTVAETNLNNLQETAARVDADQQMRIDDYEARITFLESQLTAKTSTAKIVPKAHKTTFRQFAEAASRASEPEESNG